MPSSALRKLAKAIAGTPPTTGSRAASPLTLTRAVVSGTAVTVGGGTTTTIRLAGSKTDVPADVVIGYAPVIGSTVEVLVSPPRVIILGETSALGGLGTGAGKAYATVTVAAYNSLNQNADFVCSGTDDDVTIQTAINALPGPTGFPYSTGGGQVVLLEGDYNFTGAVTSNNPCVLKGQGMYSTRIHGGEFASVFSPGGHGYGQDLCVFEDMSFENYTTGGEHTLIDCQSSGTGGPASVNFFRCGFSSPNPGISLDANSSVVSQCQFACFPAITIAEANVVALIDNDFSLPPDRTAGGYPYVTLTGSCEVLIIDRNRCWAQVGTTGYAFQFSGGGAGSLAMTRNVIEAAYDGSANQLGLVSLSSISGALISGNISPAQDTVSGVYAVDLDSGCVGNVVTNNVFYGWTINDAGTDTIRFGNVTGSGDVDGFPYPTVLTSPAMGDVLTFDGTNWVNEAGSGPPPTVFIPANTAGEATTTESPDPLYGFGTRTILETDGKLSVIAVKQLGDAHPRLVIGSDGSYYVSDGTYDPYPSGPGFVITGSGCLQFLNAGSSTQPVAFWGSVAIFTYVNPIGFVTPISVGDICHDIITPKIWQATGTGNTDWVPYVNGATQTSGALPTVTLTSGVGQQVDTNFDRRLVIPTTGTGSVEVELSPDGSTYTQLYTKSLGVSDDECTVFVPFGWYVRVTASGATLGTAVYY